jgi:threonine dehydratase
VVRGGSGYLSYAAVKKKPNHELETPTFQISALYVRSGRNTDMDRVCEEEGGLQMNKT